ncbi:MAG TPA: hypothetical protein VLJ68_13015, partial [Chitinophagaceae bacterium]|nr:hypothetical protein [Chitinophagaceae bacterium]
MEKEQIGEVLSKPSESRVTETKFRATMNTEQIAIILVDDHEITRSAWRILLENNPRFRVLADCNTDEKAAGIIKELNPDIVLV